jgi:thioesterase domain-containing protein
MTTAATCPILFLPGAGGVAPDLSLFKEGPDDPTLFQAISYPGWRRYAADDFSTEVLLTELEQRIRAAVPAGPICLMGLSLGGHLAYALALRLQAAGREIAGVCIIDSFMIESAGPSAGWQGRALAQALELLRQRRLAEFIAFVRSKFWRALLRLSPGGLTSLLQKSKPAGNSMLELETSMRLLIRITAPWIAALDYDPEPLLIPVALLRTRATASDDNAWRRRCPNLQVFEIEGHHHSLFEPQHLPVLRNAFHTATRHWPLLTPPHRLVS